MLVCLCLGPQNGDLNGFNLIVFPLLAAPLRQSGHVCPCLYVVQRREAVWLQVSFSNYVNIMKTWSGAAVTFSIPSAFSNKP